MDKPMIGIRQADGSFYEILDETAAGHKRLILSAARTDQKGVRIELFRSADGTVSPEDSLGEIALEDPEGLGYQDIEFRLDLKDGQLEASAALPGQPPRTLSVELDTDTPRRTDAAILEDDALGSDLDTLDSSFLDTEAEPATLDLPDLRQDELEAGTAPESFDMPDLDDDFSLPGLDDTEEAAVSEPAEAAIDEAAVSDEAVASDDTVQDESELDAELDSFELPELDESQAPLAAAETETEDSFDMPEMAEMPAMEETPAAEETSPDEMAAFDEIALDEMSLDESDLSTPSVTEEDEFSMDAFDEGEPAAVPSFDETTMEPDVPAGLPEAASDDPFSINDLGDMEPMEFMDTGAELSAPAPRAAASAEPDEFDVSMDTEAGTELAGMDDLSENDFGDLGELGDLPDMGDMGESSGSGSEEHASDDDLDFMAPPELTETPWADGDLADEVPLPAKGKKPPKSGKPPKAKARARAVPEPASSGGLDKTALFLSLTSLSLLVLLILVLLFLNMIKAPQTPAIQPEVMKFTPAQPLAHRQAPSSVDLAAGPKFEASTVLEVPEGLKTAEVSLTLAPGDTPADAERRFGTFAKARGNQLFW